MRLQTVHLRVNDAATLKPTPVMIRISDAAGQEYAPFGRHLDFGIGTGEDVGGSLFINREKWFAIDGATEIALPPGELRVQIRKGIAWKPIDQIVSQGAGKMAMRLNVERAHNPLERGWLQVDGRCHAMSPHAAALDGAAADLDVVNLLAKPMRYLGRTGQTHCMTPGIESFSGQELALEKWGTQVAVNTTNEHAVLGRLNLLHCHRAIHPLAFGTVEDVEHWSLSDWCGQCHRKKGLVVWSEPYRPKLGHSGEALAVAINGEIDALEVTPDQPHETLKRWYQLLNAGVTLPLIGASGKVSNARPLGAMRTLVNTGDEHWTVAVKAGRTVVTDGPMIELTIDGSRATVTGPDEVELIADGKVIARGSGEHDIGDAAWVAARVIQNGLAHTSAIRRTVVRKTVAPLVADLKRGREWVEAEITEPKFRVQLLATFDRALGTLNSGA